MEANTDFPERTLQKSFFLGLGVINKDIDEYWYSRLGIPRSGILLGITDFGNIEDIGLAYTLAPFIETGIFRKKTDRLFLNIAFGASYMDTTFDAQSNPFNRGITTSINWSFKSFFYYNLLEKNNIDWRIGLGYTHHSNGHTKLPNQGLNSFSISASALIRNTKRESNTNSQEEIKRKKNKQYYFSLRSGIGQNVLSEAFNDKKEVYSFAMSGGKVINKIFKLGLGIYGRYYEHYNDYIEEEGEFVAEQYPFFAEAPTLYASNFGVYVSSEIFMGHVGAEFDIGFNIFKPFYKVDWQLSQGYTYNGRYYPKELDWYYEVKRTVSSRLSVKYYIKNTYKPWNHNLFMSASMNANLGQADFSELSIGYVYRFL